MPAIAPPESPPSGGEKSPIVWFAELIMAMDRRDIDTAAKAKRQLADLGVVVSFRKPGPARRAEGGGQ